MVVRVPIGGYLRGGAPYHSQSGVCIFAHCPGIRIVFRYMPSDAASVRRDPLGRSGAVPRAQAPYRQTYNKGAIPARYMIPFGKARLREGTDSWFHLGRAVQRSLLAAQQAEKDGVSVRSSICGPSFLTTGRHQGLVKKTSRVIVAHEDLDVRVRRGDRGAIGRNCLNTSMRREARAASIVRRVLPGSGRR